MAAVQVARLDRSTLQCSLAHTVALQGAGSPWVQIGLNLIDNVVSICKMFPGGDVVHTIADRSRTRNEIAIRKMLNPMFIRPSAVRCSVLSRIATLQVPDRRKSACRDQQAFICLHVMSFVCDPITLAHQCLICDVFLF